MTVRRIGPYQLAACIGRGGSGEVYAATDLRSGQEVAVKRLLDHPAAELPRLRQEAAVLAALQVPGVVPILDHFDDGAHGYLVMPRVHGAPFPGLPLPAPWSALRPRVAALLRALGALHDAGWLHLDLKPENVLVDERGRPWLLDLGLAARGEQERGAAIAGTPRYLAPERLRWQRGPQSDLYAVGVMVDEALGEPAPGGEQARPAQARALVEALTRPDPALRPASAAAALLLLGEASAEAAGAPVDAWLDTQLGGGARLDPARLAALFDGPRRFLREPERAAAILWRHTGGHPGRVRAELRAWLAAGLVRLDGARLRLEGGALDALGERLGEPLGRPAGAGEAGDALLRWVRLAEPDATAAGLAAQGLPLDALEAHLAAGRLDRDPQGLLRCLVPIEPGALPRRERGALHERLAASFPVGHPSRLRHLLLARAAAAGAPDAALAAEAVAVSRAMADAGQGAQALGVLLRVGEVLLAEGEGAGLRRVLVAAVQEAIASNDRALLARFEGLARRVDAGAAADLAGLAAASRLSLEGAAGAALRQARAVPPLGAPELDGWRQAVRIQAAMQLGADDTERELAAIRGEVGADPPAELAARLAGWEGQRRYLAQDYRGAARLHALAAAGRSRPSGQAGSRLNEALALQDAGDLEAALAAARAALALARGCGHATFEALAWRVVRSVAYRLAEPLAPDPTLADELRAFCPPRTVGLAALTEAAAAWRCGEAALAVTLANRAAAVLEESRAMEAATLARCLAARCAGAGADPLLEAEAREIPWESVRLQALWLLAEGPADPLADEARALAAAVPRLVPGRRLDVVGWEDLWPGQGPR